MQQFVNPDDLVIGLKPALSQVCGTTLLSSPPLIQFNLFGQSTHNVLEPERKLPKED